MSVTESVYKGHPTLSIKFSEKAMPFCFGLSKARAIMENYGAIVLFVEAHTPLVAAVADKTPVVLDFTK